MQTNTARTDIRIINSQLQKLNLMQTNVGAFDGWFRTLLFILAICYAVFAGGVMAWVLVGVGAVLFATAVLTWCPIYEVVGLNTNGK